MRAEPTKTHIKKATDMPEMELHRVAPYQPTVSEARGVPKGVVKTADPATFAGFPNLLSQFVYTRTYSRWLEEKGRRENWSETVERYIEFISTERTLPGDVVAAIKEAVMRMEVLPSMRALWAAGPAAKRDNTCMYNCFGGNERFVTPEGLLTFQEALGRDVTVRTLDGQWRPATIQSFGHQPLVNITFGHWNGGKHGNEQHTVRVTPNHRWLLLDGTETTELKVGDKLTAPALALDDDLVDGEAVRHGFVFGDGTINRDADREYAQVRLCGKKAHLLGTVFAGFKSSNPPSYGGDPVVYCGKENVHWKQLPETTNPGYVAGFIKGLFLADGCGTTTSGNLRISTQDGAVVAWLHENAALAGYKVLSDQSYDEATNYGDRSAPLHMVLLGTGNAAVFQVEQIETLDGDGEVFCVVEPETQTFLLANGQVTGNCAFVPLDSMRSFVELLYILMMGTGIGYSVERKFTSNLPVVGVVNGVVVDHIVPDSTIGWSESLQFGLEQWFQGNRVNFDYSQVRPAGAPLKTKGGRASGPDPLKRLFDFCEKTVLAAPGRQLKPIECHDIACMIGEIVMSGGVRRAALISISDLDDEEMRHAKDWSRGSFPQLRYMANNSAYYESKPEKHVFWEEWNALVASKSGERGLSIDSWHVRSNRPRGGCRPNPCVTGDTRVMTDKGFVKILDLVGHPTNVAIDRRFNTPTPQEATTLKGAFKTGEKPVYTLMTVEGYQVRLTGDHQVMTSDGWKEAQHLESGDIIHIANTEGMFGKRGGADAGLLGGWITGDGCLLAADNNSPRLYFYGADHHLVDQMLDATERLTGSRPSVSTFDPKDRQHFECAALREYLGQIIKDKFRIPEFVWQGTEDCQRSYLSALFSADGGVQGTRDKGVSVRLASSKLNLLYDVQQLLLNFGIACKVYRDRRPAGYRDLPDGKGGYKSYLCNADHELMISKTNMVRFAERIGFIHEKKQHILRTEINNRMALAGQIGVNGRPVRGFYKESFTARFDFLSLDGVEDVFDMTVPVTHSFVANGLVVHNCGEIGLRFLMAMRDLMGAIKGTGGSGQFCVAGDTPLVTRQGVIDIRDAAGRSVEVWNGEKWSEVRPFQTGIGQKLYRVHMSDGSYLDTTAYHRFSVSNKNTRGTKTPWREMTVSDILDAGVNKRWATEPFKIEQEEGELIDEGHAYTAGAVVGDGWIRKTSGNGQPNPRVYMGLWGEKDAVMPVVGVRGTPHVANASNLALKMTTVFCPDQDPDMITALKTEAEALDGLFLWCRESILQFFAGWLDADGAQQGSGVRLYVSDEARARKTQLLLTRCGIRSSIRLVSAEGAETNLGVRKRDLWYVSIIDCASIPCHRLDTSKGHKPRFKSKFQTIHNIEELPGLHPTFCFDESERHMGVFGNTLTYQCNLSAAVMRSEDTLESFAEKVRLATWIGAIQSTFTHFPFLRPGWSQTCNEDRLLGVDITGQCDAPHLSQNPEAMAYFNRVALETAAAASAYLGINMPVAVTCGKPSGNSSQLVDCASGFHARYSPYYIRRVRIAGTDPLFRLVRDAGVPCHKDNQFTDYSDEDCPTWVVEFPVKAPDNAVFRNDETAIQMLERYLLVMKTWCGKRGHNQSVTIYVKDHEWDMVGDWVFKHFDEITGISFLPYDGGSYKLAPYEEIDEATYNEWVSWFPVVDFEELTRFEKEDRGEGAVELACSGGSCAVDYDKMAMEMGKIEDVDSGSKAP